MEKPTCGIMQDLLISYCDGLTSEGVTRMLQEHLDECPKCMEKYRQMKEKQEAEEKNEQIKGNRFGDKIKSIRYFVIGVLIGLILPVAAVGLWFLVRLLISYTETMFFSYFMWG